ncbi:MAG: ISL3 family transposase [Burkholderiales bacterium]
MRDVELYQQLLGLVAPWTVGRVELSVEGERVDIWAEHAPEVRWPCPECATLLSVYDHAEERAWRHLDSCQFKTYLHARVPRIKCPTHGTRQVKLPWAEARSRFTLLFERLAIDVLKEASVRGATRILRISWDEAWHLMERAVKRGLQAKGKSVPARLGVDEKALSKGARYITLVCNLDAATIEHVAEARRMESLDGYFLSFPAAQLEGIRAIAMDMWPPYIASTLRLVPGARDKIVFDLYHVMSFMNEAVDEVRKREHREYRARGDETLARSRYLWLYAQERLPQKHQERFAALRAMNLKTGRAWAIKESLREFWKMPTREQALAHWKHWYRWATHSRLKPVIKTAKNIQHKLHNVLTYFTHRITNAVAEGLNSKIQTIKKAAYGFRSFENFRTAIFFHCGGLQLYPVTHAKPG